MPGPHACKDYTEAFHHHCHVCEALLSGINWLRQLLNWQRLTWDIRCSAAELEFEYERLMDHHWPGRTTYRRLKAPTTQTGLTLCNDWDTPKQSLAWPSARDAYNVYQSPVIEVCIGGARCNVRLLPPITGYGYMDANEGRRHNRRYLAGANYIAGLLGHDHSNFFDADEYKDMCISPAELMGCTAAPQPQPHQNRKISSQRTRELTRLD